MPGWFVESGSAGNAVRCDEDNDGWVNEDADSTTDPQRLANARCSIRRVDRVLLQDELGVGLAVRSCDAEGLVTEASNPACVALPLRLLETGRNDVPGQPTETRRAPAYGYGDAGATAGRELAAAELNSLTKACTSLRGDYNDNGLDDVAEVAANFPTITPARARDRDRLEEFSYFVELHTSQYLPAADGGALGTLAIRERSRCSSGGATPFPFRYLTADGGQGATQ
jgi:hypothetical protein